MASLSHRRARVALMMSVVGTIACTGCRWDRRHTLVLLSTLAHELGHGIAALLVGGGFESFVLYADGSGAAMTRAIMDGLRTRSLARAACGWPRRERLLHRGSARQGRKGALLFIGCALVVAW